MSDKELTPKKAAQIDTSWHEAFLRELADEPNVSRAARIAGTSRQTAYSHRDDFPDFALAWDNAIHVGIEKLEEEMHRRAYRGYDKPVTFQGDITATYKEYSDTLAIFLAKAHRPEKYNPITHHAHTSDNKHEVKIDLSNLTGEQLRAIIESLEE